MLAKWGRLTVTLRQLRDISPMATFAQIMPGFGQGCLIPKMATKKAQSLDRAFECRESLRSVGVLGVLGKARHDPVAFDQKLIQV